jgi:peroxiredoxin
MAEQRTIQSGDVAPDFELSDSAGQPRRFSELTRDRPCIVIFYRGHW